MKIIEVEVTGISPLLQHRYPLENSEEPKAKAKNKQQNEDNVEQSLYRMPDGTIYQPAIHFISTMKRAGSKYQVPGQGKATYKNIVGSGAVIVTPEAIPHRIQEWEIDVRPVVIKSTKGRIPRKRPVLKSWALRFSIEYDPDEISPATIKELLEYAGRRVGIGDFRPECGGPFGRFMVTQFKG
jgi:hypothetical protein